MMENIDRAKVRIAAMTGVSSARGLHLKMIVRTSKGEWAIDVIPPCSVYTTPTDED